MKNNAKTTLSKVSKYKCGKMETIRDACKGRNKCKLKNRAHRTTSLYDIMIKRSKKHKRSLNRFSYTEIYTDNGRNYFNGRFCLNFARELYKINNKNNRVYNFTGYGFEFDEKESYKKCRTRVKWVR